MKDLKINNNKSIEFVKTNIEFKIKQNNDFQTYFSNLSKDLIIEYEANINAKEKQERIDFLQRSIDEITEALNDAEYNYTLSEISEKRKPGLIELRSTFEKRLNDIYFKDEKRREQAINLLKNIKDKDKKVDFINILREEFKGCEPKKFVTLITCLIYKEYLDMSKTTKIEIQKSFEKELKPKTCSESYFRKELTILLSEIKRLKNLEEGNPDIYAILEKIKGIEHEYQIKD